MDRYTQGTLVTANARLSRQLRRDYDSDRRRQDLQVWESPDILPRGAWLARAWQECAYRDPFDTPVLLSPLQEEALWEQAIAASDGASVLLDLPATVSTAAQAWSLVRAWEAPCNVAEFRGLARSPRNSSNGCSPWNASCTTTIGLRRASFRERCSIASPPENSLPASSFTRVSTN